MWNREKDQESDDNPRIWKHQKSGEKVEVKKYENGTWDTFREDTLIENFDDLDDAIERGRQLVDSN